MGTDQELRKIARETADYAQGCVAHLEQEVRDLETLLADKKKELDAASLAPKRLANFQVAIAADYQCPYCWIHSGAKSPLARSAAGPETRTSSGAAVGIT
jgi:hypothetical protein